VNYDKRAAWEGVSGSSTFSQNTQTYYTSARLDFEVTKKLRVYASLALPTSEAGRRRSARPDSSTGLFNVSSTVDPSAYSHGVGYTAPNTTINVGADYSLNLRVSF